MHPVEHAQAVEAAKQRILRVKAGESRKVVYDFDGEDMDNFMYRMMENAETRDLKVLAEEYLALSSLSAPGPSRDAEWCKKFVLRVMVETAAYCSASMGSKPDLDPAVKKFTAELTAAIGGIARESGVR